jgi:ATP-dependent helicase HrpB
MERVVATRLGVLSWDDDALALRRRIAAARHHRPDEGWPDVSDAALVAGVEDWLGPHLARCTGREDLERIDLSLVLSAMLGWDLSSALSELVPTHIVSARGRRVAIDWSEPDRPRASVRVQDMYGTTTHPVVVDGRVPVIVELLSPAGRPIQVTADLPGFWSGSWGEVRREMAGRYPKHDWPVDPTVG